MGLSTKLKLILLSSLSLVLTQETCPQGQKWNFVFDSCDDCEDNDPDPACAPAPPPSECPLGQKRDPVFEECEDCKPGDTDPNCQTEISEDGCPPGQVRDPVFEDCQPQELCHDGQPPHPEYGCDKCFDSINEIEDAIFNADPRTAFNDCNPDRPCSFYSKQGYACAPSWTCHNNTIITDGKGLIDVRQADDDDKCSAVAGTLDRSDQKCPNIQDVCCQRPNFRAEPCTEAKPPKFDPVGECGRSQVKLSFSGISASEQDTTAQPGEFPHMCVIYRIVKGSRTYLSGASLIGPNKVLTSAHKFLVTQRGKTTDITGDPSQFFVRCGEYNVKARTELLPHQESQVEAIHLHPDYVKERVYNNLVILQTRENFIYDDHIGPVCLPGVNQDFSGESNCWSSGWGADDFDSIGRFSDTLKKVKMPVVDSPSCQTRLRAHERLAKNQGFRIHESWVCVGGEEGVDTCKGDGGSPHVCKSDDGKFVQVGSVAFGLGCGDPVPSIYSSVPHAMCWIDWVMSCVPLSNINVDTTTNNFVFDLRTDEDDTVENIQDSVNQLSPSDCRKWNNDHPSFYNRCQVRYFEIDQRDAGK